MGELKILDKRWVKYIRSSHAKSGSMYGLFKPHKENNPARVITSGCVTAIEFLSVFVEKYSYKEVDKTNSRIKDTSEILDIIDDINNNNNNDNNNNSNNNNNMITNSSILVSFDIVNMFPSIDNISGLVEVSEILSNRESDFSPAECILEALTICLECNNFDNVFYLQENGTAMDPHMSCSYSDIAMYRFDIKALNYRPGVQCWKRFRDDIFCLWNHSLEELQKFFEFMNNVDTTRKIKFTMSVACESVLEFLDMDVFAKLTDSFTYVLPSTCYPKKNINNVTKGIALRLRRICDTDEKFDIRSSDYQNFCQKTVSSY